MTTYHYGSDGLRDKKTTGSDTIKYYCDENGIVLNEANANGSHRATNVVGADGTIIARKNQSGDIGKFIKNEHGDVTNVIGETASNTYKYEPWGTITAKTGTFDNPIRYSGEYYDDESGLIYLRNRYYDPSLRRFISEDPAKDGLNWYAYCGNNPVNYWDPTGNIREGQWIGNQWISNPDEWEFGAGSDTYKILVDLGHRWQENSNMRSQFENMANEVRRLAREGTPIKYGQDKIMSTLHNNAREADKYIENFYEIQLMGISIKSPYEWFVSKTCNEWDYKRNSDWQVPYSVFNGSNMNKNNAKNWTPWIYFDGMIISGDKFGNINLGYIGTKMGFEGIMVENMFTMDKDDGPYVRYGINMARQGR